MTSDERLPPGQYDLGEFPRFGLSRFVDRFPEETRRIRLKIDGDVGESVTIEEDELRELPRVEQTSDFHCVTTWSCRALRWSGFRFADFFERLVVPRASPRPDATLVVLRCQDGYVSSLPLSDLLVESVLLADTLNGEPLPLEHGAPLRLIAPEHYGYKNPKHVCAVELWRDESHYRPAALRFMDHPRARVALEERGRGVPGWLLRHLYRPLVRQTIRQFRRALERHAAAQRGTG